MARQIHSRRAGWLACGAVLFSLAGLLLLTRWKAPAKFAAPAPVVEIVFPVGSDRLFRLRNEVEKIVAGLPNVRRLSIVVGADDRTAAMIVLTPGSDAEKAIASLNSRLLSWRDAHSEILWIDGGPIAQHTSSQLIFVRIEGTQAWREQPLLYNRALGDLIDKLNRTPGIYPPIAPSGWRPGVMWIGLDVEQMRKRNVSADDALGAMADSGDAGHRSFKLVRQTSKTIEYAHAVQSAGGASEQYHYSRVILKTNPDGEVVRFGDVGRVEFHPPYYDPESKLEARPAVTVMLTARSGASLPAIVAEVRQKLTAIQATSLLPGMTFEISREAP